MNRTLSEGRVSAAMTDLLGDISLVLNIASLFLVGIGVVGRKGSKNNYLRHGYLSILGFFFKLVTVFVAMIPPLLTEALPELREFSIFQVSFLGIKLVLGIGGTVMGFICIAPWVIKNRDMNACLKVKRWMWPTLVVWILAVIFGAAIHLGEII